MLLLNTSQISTFWHQSVGQENKAAIRVWGRERVEQLEWSWRELQQSLHKRGGLCNGCGFVSLRNLGRAKHIQMCQTGTRPTQAASHIRLRMHKNEGRGEDNTRIHYGECRVMLSQKHERHAVVWANPVSLIRQEQGLLTVGL